MDSLHSRLTMLAFALLKRYTPPPIANLVEITVVIAHTFETLSRHRAVTSVMAVGSMETFNAFAGALVIEFIAAGGAGV